MDSTSSNSSRLSKSALRNNRFYLKKFKPNKLKKKSGDKMHTKKDLLHQLQLRNHEKFDGEDQHRREEQINNRDDFDNRKSLDRRANPDDEERFDRRDDVDIEPLVGSGREQVFGQHHENGDQERVPHFHENVDVESRRKEEETRKKCKRLKMDMAAMNMDSDREQVSGSQEKDGDLHRPNDVLDINENDDVDNSRKEEKTLEKERKRYKKLKSDMAAMNAKVDLLVRELKAIKTVVKRWDAGPQPMSDDDDIDQFDELPPLPISKRKSVKLMEKNATASRSYKKQLIAKLRTIGGADIKKNVINIFKVLFSSTLKTKICWKGSVRKKKMAFENFSTLLDVLRQAVAYRHKKCGADDIARECKLRFKQAEKDLARELMKEAQN